ncbi:hypothetical protein HYH03_017006 [Edaphochlamys debaryana]|uniref:Inositol polyphosphate-related phosphatase domain-containing protein n=1 Tax=Edaphochlamys debaryana TaxID=47281 RepID=A0A836BQW9_9CHLO|nr:hypothetical protein HYH03_017006 [Edaphochlamys debaryana]|eukprot:KAG2484194.1 hypothetical protein HYH03_017006 [Edaphochlamys debaryana]
MVAGPFAGPAGAAHPPAPWPSASGASASAARSPGPPASAPRFKEDIEIDEETQELLVSLLDIRCPSAAASATAAAAAAVASLITSQLREERSMDGSASASGGGASAALSRNRTPTVSSSGAAPDAEAGAGARSRGVSGKGGADPAAAASPPLTFRAASAWGSRKQLPASDALGEDEGNGGESERVSRGRTSSTSGGAQGTMGSAPGRDQAGAMRGPPSAASSSGSLSLQPVAPPPASTPRRMGGPAPAPAPSAALTTTPILVSQRDRSSPSGPTLGPPSGLRGPSGPEGSGRPPLHSGTGLSGAGPGQGQGQGQGQTLVLRSALRHVSRDAGEGAVGPGPASAVASVVGGRESVEGRAAPRKRTSGSGPTQASLPGVVPSSSTGAAAAGGGGPRRSGGSKSGGGGEAAAAAVAVAVRPRETSGSGAGGGGGGGPPPPRGPAPSISPFAAAGQGPGPGPGRTGPTEAHARPTAGPHLLAAGPSHGDAGSLHSGPQGHGPSHGGGQRAVRFSSSGDTPDPGASGPGGDAGGGHGHAHSPGLVLGGGAGGGGGAGRGAAGAKSAAVADDSPLLSRRLSRGLNGLETGSGAGGGAGSGAGSGGMRVHTGGSEPSGALSPGTVAAIAAALGPAASSSQPPLTSPDGGGGGGGRVSASGYGGGGGPTSLRRAVGLAPLAVTVVPTAAGGLSVVTADEAAALRSALAAAAVENAAALAGGAGLAEADYGYSRVVAAHTAAAAAAPAAVTAGGWRPSQDGAPPPSAAARRSGNGGGGGSDGAGAAAGGGGAPPRPKGTTFASAPTSPKGSRKVSEGSAAAAAASASPSPMRGAGGGGGVAHRGVLKRDSGANAAANGASGPVSAPAAAAAAAAGGGFGSVSVLAVSDLTAGADSPIPLPPMPPPPPPHPGLAALAGVGSDSQRTMGAALGLGLGLGAGNMGRRGTNVPPSSAADLFGLSPSAPEDPDAEPPLDLALAESVDVRIHCLTFNMGGAAPSAAQLPEALFSGSHLGAPGDSEADAAELYVFATQESGPLGDWEAAVAAHLGRRYVRVAGESLMAIHILLFAVKPLAPHITEVRTSSVATGVGNMLGNKGGVAVTFNLAGAQILLVGAHFAAHDQHIERRNADFHRICAGLFAPPSSPSLGPGGPGPGPGGPTSVPGSLSNANPGGPSPARGDRTTASGAAWPMAGGGHASALPPSAFPQGSGSEPATPAGPGAQSRSTTPGRSRPGVGPGGPGGMSRLSRTARGQHPLPTGGARWSGNGTGNGNGNGNGGGGGGAGGTASGPEGEGGGAVSRGLSRTLSSGSNSSAVSGVSAYPESRAPSVSRSRAPSFWSGMSFATAQSRANALLSHFDMVLWMGDLNYRIAGNPEVVKYAIDNNMVEVLAANDQLHNQQRKGKVLQGFAEMPIAFAPTFKFTPGTDTYDLKRTPAWTDRVLFLVNADPLFADLKPLYYMSVPELRTSDHKPVIAGFELSICPQHAGANRHAKARGCSIM